MKMKVVLRGTAKGVFFYPGYYRDDRGRGDPIMIAPSYIITEAQVDQCVEALEFAIRESVKTDGPP